MLLSVVRDVAVWCAECTGGAEEGWERERRLRGVWLHGNKEECAQGTAAGTATTRWSVCQREDERGVLVE
jgi:hypothetical protein